MITTERQSAGTGSRAVTPAAETGHQGRLLPVLWILVMSLVTGGCAKAHRLRLYHHDIHGDYWVLRLSEAESARDVRARFDRIAKRTFSGAGRIYLVGLYGSIAVPSPEFSPKKPRQSHWDTEMIFRGRDVWGGVLAMYDSRGRLLMWLHEPRHRDRLISSRYGLLEAGRWEMDRDVRLMLFCYFRNGDSPVPGWRAWLERHILPLQQRFKRIQVLVFSDRLECRRFASSENRRSRLLTAAISPGGQETYLHPVDFSKGYWRYSGHWLSSGWTGSWRQVVPKTRR